MMSENNMLHGRTYEAKRILYSICISYEKIHACPNDCILFRNEYASLNMCLKCYDSRNKKNESSLAEVLWYFPLMPHCLFKTLLYTLLFEL